MEALATISTWKSKELFKDSKLIDGSRRRAKIKHAFKIIDMRDCKANVGGWSRKGEVKKSKPTKEIKKPTTTSVSKDEMVEDIINIMSGEIIPRVTIKGILKKYNINRRQLYAIRKKNGLLN